MMMTMMMMMRMPEAGNKKRTMRKWISRFKNEVQNNKIEKYSVIEVVKNVYQIRILRSYAEEKFKMVCKM